MKSNITKEDFITFQKAWGNEVVKIGRLHLNGEAVAETAKQLVQNFYGYSEGQVMFKPTKARDIQFRLSAESAISYFIGNNKNYPEDMGFALQPWTKVRFENVGFIFTSQQTICMGNYFFTDLQSQDTKVEFTMGCFRNAENKIKINLHHSSLPFPKD